MSVSVPKALSRSEARSFKKHSSGLKFFKIFLKTVFRFLVFSAHCKGIF